jgi:hypothetical protein
MGRQYALCLLVLLALLGCSSRQERRSASLRYETKSLSRSFGVCDSAGTPCVRVHFTYPALTRTGSPAADSIALHIDRQMFSSLEDADVTQPFDSIVSGLVEQYGNLREEFADYHTPWMVERSCSVAVDTAGVVSIRFEEASYLGGAHGMEIVRLASFDASSGRRIMLGDMFRPGVEGEFARIAEREFRAARHIPDSSSLGDAGFWIEEGEFSPPQNVAVGDSVLILYYNPYEVAPYAMGPTEVHIPFGALKDLLRRDGALAGLTSSL